MQGKLLLFTVLLAINIEATTIFHELQFLLFLQHLVLQVLLILSKTSFLQVFIQYSVPLFTGGALEEQIKIDNIAQKMAQGKKRLSREELIYNICSLYLSALSLQELQKAQEQFVQALEEGVKRED